MPQLTRVPHHVSTAERARKTGHSGAVVWLTGLSGAGKSTLAMAVERRLFDEGYDVYVLDGDNIRYGLNSDLGFSLEDRKENIRRIGEVASLFADAGLVCITSFISPLTEDREAARVAAGESPFIEVFVEAALSTCEQRDPKGLYRKARAGELKDMTGIDSPYQAPERADVIIRTDMMDVETACATLARHVKSQIQKV